MVVTRWTTTTHIELGEALAVVVESIVVECDEVRCATGRHVSTSARLSPKKQPSWPAAARRCSVAADVHLGRWELGRTYRPRPRRSGCRVLQVDTHTQTNISHLVRNARRESRKRGKGSQSYSLPSLPKIFALFRERKREVRERKQEVSRRVF